MASTVLVKEVLWRASLLLSDSAPQFVRYSEAELVGYLDDAQMAVAKYIPSAASRVDVVKLKPGTRQSLERIAAADCLPGDGQGLDGPVLGTGLLAMVRNMGTNGATPGRVIRPTSRKVLDAQNPTWHMLAGSPIREYVYDPLTPRYFYVVPAVPATGGAVWAEISYTAQPVKLPPGEEAGSERYRVEDDDTTVIGISDEFADDLVNYIVARANMKATDWSDGNKATAFAGLFTSSINAVVTARMGVNPNLKRLPFAPSPEGSAS